MNATPIVCCVSEKSAATPETRGSSRPISAYFASESSLGQEGEEIWKFWEDKVWPLKLVQAQHGWWGVKVTIAWRPTAKALTFYSIF